MARVAVVGSGVSGLSCAIRLLEAGHEVEVWHSPEPTKCVSSVATAVWHLYLVEDSDRTRAWAARTRQVLIEMAQQAGTGVSLLRGVELLRHPPPSTAATGESVEWLSPEELADYPGIHAAYRVVAPAAEMPIYLPWLRARVQKLSGDFVRSDLTMLEEVSEQARVVVNCAGLGARELVDDPTLVPIRGQAVRVRLPPEHGGLRKYVGDDDHPAGPTFFVPLTHYVVIGGTSERGVEDIAVSPQQVEAMRAAGSSLEPELSTATVLEAVAGLRPYRQTVRLEHGVLSDGRAVVHNYGHGGSGFSLSWGCAEAVLALIGSVR